MLALRLAAVIAFALLTVGARAEAPAGVSVEATEVGLAGKYRVGLWCPVRVTLANASGEAVTGRLEATTADNEAGPCTFVASNEIAVPVRGKIAATLYVRFGRLSGTLDVRFKSSQGGASASRSFSTAAGDYPRAALSTQRLYVALGARVGLEEAFPPSGREDDPERPVSVTVTDPASLPDRWYGYEGVTAIVLPTAPAASGDDFLARLSPAQWQALSEWVQLGGRLVVSLGARGRELAAFEQNPLTTSLASLIPARVAGAFEQRSASGLESFAQNKTPLDLSGGRTFTMAHLEALPRPEDKVEQFGAASRLIVLTRPHGFGVVTCLATDLDRGPIAAWQDRPLLVSKLLAAAAHEEEAAVNERGGQLTHLGFTDLAGQLGAALDEFPGVWTPPFLAIAGLLVGYLLLIGPGDYFFLKGALGQMPWTWVTFPFIVAGFVLLAWLVAGQAKGDSAAVNQLAIVDVDASGDPQRMLVRGSAWAHVYSPRTDLVDLSFAPNAAGAKSSGRLLAWHGLPGNAFGGLDRAGESSAWPRDYSIFPEAPAGQPLIAGLPIQVGSSRAVAARWWGETSLAYDALLTASVGPPQGEVQNPLPIALEECRLFYDRWIFQELGKLPPGGKRGLAGQTARDLRYVLTRRRPQESKENQPRYDREGRDLDRIAEMLMFHETAGGRTYTDLTQRYEPFVDLSPALHGGRAILVGRAASPAMTLTRDGQPLAPNTTRTWTWYRIVLPVRPAPADAN